MRPDGDWTQRLRGAALTAPLVALAIAATPASATTFPAACTAGTGDPNSLIAAIDSANAHPGPDSVALGAGCTYTLTSVNNNWFGPDGLPPIASPITIEGHGATIARSPSAPTFRLLFVGADPTSLLTDGYVSPGPGALTLEQVTLTGGLAKGGDSNGGGGGAGLGGAIFSQGTVIVDASTIAGNIAEGGAATNNFAGIGGGGIGTNSPGGGGGGGFGPGSFGGGSGGTANSGGGGGGAGFRVTENGNPADGVGNPGAGGGPRTGLGGAGGNGVGGSGAGAVGGDGGGGGGRGAGDPGGAFGNGGVRAGDNGGSGGGGVGGGGAAFGALPGQGGGGGGFGGGGGTGAGNAAGGSGGFGGGGAYGPGGGGGAGFGGGTATTTGGGGGGAGLGGAIFNMQGRVVVINSTLAGNSALGGSDNVADHAKGIGGAVFNLNGSVSATGSTFAANAAAFDGASIYNLVDDGATSRTAQTTLVDTIVAQDTGPFELASAKPADAGGVPNLGSASVDVSGFDLVRSSHTVGTGAISGSPLLADPLLGVLGRNGGPTPTMLPASRSPAIDAAPRSSCPATDQRGLPRPDRGEGMCDIGAVEVQDPPPPPGGGGGGKVPVVHITRLAPPAFPAAPTGGSTAAAKRRHYGTTVSYTVNEAALLLVTVGRGQVGRRGKGGRCVALTRKNRTARHCTRLIMLRGSFTVSGRAGRNRFHFTGRLRGRRLAPGRYRLQATPTAGGKRGRTAAAAFRITR